MFISKIKSKYWYSTKDRKRKSISLKDLKSEKGLEVIHDKRAGRYFFHVPVEI